MHWTLFSHFYNNDVMSRMVDKSQNYRRTNMSNETNTAEPTSGSKEGAACCHQDIAYEIVALLAERGAKMKDARLILQYTNDLLAFTPIVRLSQP
jgi:hypothetical protein